MADDQTSSDPSPDTQTPAPTIPDSPPETAPEPPKQDSRRELLSKWADAAELSGEGEDPPEPEQDSEGEQDPEETEQSSSEVTPKTPKSETPEIHDDEDTPPEPDKATDEDLQDLAEDEVKVLHQKTQHRIKRLISEVKRARPAADLGTEIVDMCQKNGFTPDQYRSWVELGVDLAKDPEKAKSSLRATAERLGIPLTSDAPRIDPDEVIRDLSDTLDLDDRAERLIRKSLEKFAKPVAATPPPAPVPTPQTPPPPAQPAQDPLAPAKTRARAEMDRIADQVETRHGAEVWEKIAPGVSARLARQTHLHPDAYPFAFRDAVNAELRRLAPGPTTQTVPDSLPPNRQPAAPAQPKSQRESLVQRWGR